MSMPDAVKLEPCPFCGGEAERFVCEETDNIGGHVIGCKVCQASTRVFFGEHEGLLEAWNTRPTSEREARLVEAARHMDQCFGEDGYEFDMEMTMWRLVGLQDALAAYQAGTGAVDAKEKP